MDWIIFDLAPRFDYAEALRKASEVGGLCTVIDLLLEHRDPVRLEEAQEVLEGLVEVDTPLASVPWDQVSVMVYRPTFSEFLGVPLPPGSVLGKKRCLSTTVRNHSV